MAPLELIAFVPETASYRIFYPKHFQLDEAPDGTVNLVSPETDSMLTLTSYQANQQVTEEILFGFFKEQTIDYQSTSEILEEVIEGKISFEGMFKKDNQFWLWRALSSSNAIILATVNSEDVLNIEDYDLYKAMLDGIEIYPPEQSDTSIAEQ